MEFVVKKTFELSASEKERINGLFNEVFEKQRTIRVFENQFVNNVLGHSYHSMMIDRGEIVGCDTFVPSYYNLDGKKHLFANSVDTMVGKHYRDLFNFMDMVNAAYGFMKNDGVEVVYGFPNDNSYEVNRQTKLLVDIGKMYTYCLPYRVGGIKKGLGLLNPLSKLYVHCRMGMYSLIADKKPFKFAIKKDDSYNQTRYKRMDGDYKIKTYKGVWFAFKIMTFDNVRTAFLIDVEEKSEYNFNVAVRYIIKNYAADFDILLYIGCLPSNKTGLVRLPMKLAPKNFNFMAKVLNPATIPSGRLFQIGQWDVNLSNYDLL